MPKRVDHEALRSELGLRALALFAERGYAGLSMRDAALALGLPKSSMYHYFPTKEALFSAAVGAATDQDQAGLSAALKGARGAEGLARRLAAFVVSREAEFREQAAILFEVTRGAGPGLGGSVSSPYGRTLATEFGLDGEGGELLFALINGAIVTTWTQGLAASPEDRLARAILAFVRGWKT